MNKVASNKSVSLLGETFYYVKLTRPIHTEFVKFHDECEEKKKKALEPDAPKVDSKYGSRAVYDAYDYYADLLKFILVGPTEKITADALDQREAEEIIMGFFPESQRLRLMLVGF